MLKAYKRSSIARLAILSICILVSSASTVFAQNTEKSQNAQTLMFLEKSEHDKELNIYSEFLVGLFQHKHADLQGIPMRDVNRTKLQIALDNVSQRLSPDNLKLEAQAELVKQLSNAELKALQWWYESDENIENRNLDKRVSSVLHTLSNSLMRGVPVIPNQREKVILNSVFEGTYPNNRLRSISKIVDRRRLVDLKINAFADPLFIVWEPIVSGVDGQAKQHFTRIYDETKNESTQAKIWLRNQAIGMVAIVLADVDDERLDQYATDTKQAGYVKAYTVVNDLLATAVRDAANSFAVPSVIILREYAEMPDS